MSFKALAGGLVLVAVYSVGALAAPHPGMGSSKSISPQLGIYRSPLGFEISAGDSGWSHEAAPKDNPLVTTIYQSKTVGKNGEAPTLTVRVDKLEKDTPIEKYVQKWMKEYPKYGFDVIGSQAFTQKKDRGYVVDLINRDSGKQLRQVVFMKNQKAVILTCRDLSATFKNTLKQCNQIVRTFSWSAI